MMQKLRGNWVSRVFGFGGVFPSPKIKSCLENVPADTSKVKCTLMLVVGLGLLWSFRCPGSSSTVHLVLESGRSLLWSCSCP